MRHIGVYIHWPYCISKCPYCDFNSHVLQTVDMAVWQEAYVREIAYYAAQFQGARVESVFFGGGTPSLMPATMVGSILEAIAKNWQMDEACEITLEANPSTFESEKFLDFRAAGVNRLSIGVQSLQDEALQFLGRPHNAAEAVQAVECAARIFPRFSFDLIYARRNQTLRQWEGELKQALEMGGKHLSLYQLTIEPQTPFAARAKAGEQLILPEAEAAEMFEFTNETMLARAMPPYEISNYAAQGHESRHNLIYWRYNDYLGIGPGAHRRVARPTGIEAGENHRAPQIWLEAVASAGQGTKKAEILTAAESMHEATLMGLRLAEGLDVAAWKKKFGCDLQEFLGRTKLAKLQAEGLLDFEGVMPEQQECAFIRTTAQGKQRLDAMLAYLLAA